MNDEELDALREHFDRDDMASQLEAAEPLPAPVVEPYVTTSVRLPMAVMRQVRRHARERGVKPTVLLREWIEAALAEELSETEAVIPVTVLRSAIAEYLSGRRAS